MTISTDVSTMQNIYTIKLVFVKKPHFIADILMLAFTEPPFRGRERRHAMALMGRKCVL